MKFQSPVTISISNAAGAVSLNRLHFTPTGSSGAITTECVRWRHLGELPVFEQLLARALQAGGDDRGCRGGGAPGQGEEATATGVPSVPSACCPAPAGTARHRPGPWRPRLSAPAPGVRPCSGAPLSGLLPPALWPVSSAVRASSAASIGSGRGKRVFAASGATTAGAVQAPSAEARPS